MMATSHIDPSFEPIDTTVSLYEQIGAEHGVRALVERFYDLMEMEDDLSALRAAHGPSLQNARERLFMFLSGYLGGPDLYIERHGHPRLRARHLPFSIGQVERDQWVVCMGRAMQDVGVAPALAERLLHSFYGTADWMRNRAE
jgi:hemoglobin